MKRLLIALLLVLSARGAWAQTPTVSAYSGTLSGGNSITVTGTNFGSTGPTPAIFDDLEGGTNGNAMTTGLAEVGTWSSIGTGQVPHYSTDHAVSGTRSMKVDTATDPSGGANGGTGAAVDFTSKDVLATFWVMVPVGDAPIGNGNSPNWKITWMYRSGTTDNDITPATTSFPESTLCPGHYACNWQLFGNDQPMSGDNAGYFDGPCGSSGYSPCTGTGDWTMDTGKWYRVVQYYHGDTASHATAVNDVWVSSADAAHAYTHHYHSDHANQSTTGNWLEFVFNGFSRQTTSGTARIYMDDLYVATSGTAGAAQARIEIGDASTYTACQNLTVVTPTSWAAGSVTGTVRQGSFGATAAGYLYVTNSSGLVNASGFAVTFGAAGGGGGGGGGTQRYRFLRLGFLLFPLAFGGAAGYYKERP